MPSELPARTARKTGPFAKNGERPPVAHARPRLERFTRECRADDAGAADLRDGRARDAAIALDVHLLAITSITCASPPTTPEQARPAIGDRRVWARLRNTTSFSASADAAASHAEADEVVRALLSGVLRSDHTSWLYGQPQSRRRSKSVSCQGFEPRSARRRLRDHLRLAVRVVTSAPPLV